MSNQQTQSEPLALTSFEWGLLLLLAFTLPLFEGPKNIACGLFLLVWLGRRAFARNWGGPWCGWDTLFASFIGVAALTAAMSAPFAPQWNEVVDVVRYVSLGWMLSRIRFSSRQAAVLLLTLGLSTLGGLAWGYWAWKIAQTKNFLELHSVGHVNHSAIYIAAVGLGIAGSWLASLVRGRWPVRLGLGALALLFLVVVTTNESRGAMFGYVFGLLVLVAAFVPLLRTKLVAVTFFIVAAGAIALLTNPYLIEKSLILVQVGNPFSFRMQLAHTAIEGWRHEPLTGVGPRNFRVLDAGRISEWVKARGETYVPAYYFHSSHAHSVYFNTLAERGLLGIAALFALIVAWLAALVRRRPTCRQDGVSLAVWSFALASLTGVAVMGFFNTSLHHEHALLAMLSLGLLLGYRPDQRAIVPGNQAA